MKILENLFIGQMDKETMRVYGWFLLSKNIILFLNKNIKNQRKWKQ